MASPFDIRLPPPQGWQCPVCCAVMSPQALVCLFCMPSTTTVSPGTSTVEYRQNAIEEISNRYRDLVKMLKDMGIERG